MEAGWGYHPWISGQPKVQASLLDAQGAGINNSTAICATLPPGVSLCQTLSLCMLNQLSAHNCMTTNKHLCFFTFASQVTKAHIQCGMIYVSYHATLYVCFGHLYGKPFWTQYITLHEDTLSVNSTPKAFATACTPAFLSNTAPCKNTSTACVKLSHVDCIIVLGRATVVLSTARGS